MFVTFWWHTYPALYPYPYNMGIRARNSCDHSKSEELLGIKLLMKSISFYKLLWSVFDLRIAGCTLNIVQYASFEYKNKFSGRNLASRSEPELTPPINLNFLGIFLLISLLCPIAFLVSLSAKLFFHRSLCCSLLRIMFSPIVLACYRILTCHMLKKLQLERWT